MADVLVNDKKFYRKWTHENLRYGDLDPVGHVNNNAYGLFIENARTMLFSDAENLALSKDDDSPNCDWVLRKLEYDFLREVRYPGTVSVGIAVTKIGKSSMVVAHGVFANDYCAATAVGVSVYFDLQRRTSTPIPAAIQDAMLKLARPNNKL